MRSSPSFRRWSSTWSAVHRITTLGDVENVIVIVFSWDDLPNIVETLSADGRAGLNINHPPPGLEQALYISRADDADDADGGDAK